MATEGVKQFKFANRQDVLITHHVVALVTAMGRIRAEYIGGTEDKQTLGDPPKTYWTYQFKILEEDIPSGYTFDAINESVFVEPYLEKWDTEAPCDALCFKAAEVEINETPDYILGVTEQASECEDDPTVFCQTRLTIPKLVEMVVDEMPPCECCDDPDAPAPCVTKNYALDLFEDSPGEEITDLNDAAWFTVTGCGTSFQPTQACINVAAPGVNSVIFVIRSNGVIIGDGVLPPGETSACMNDFINPDPLSNGDVITVDIDPLDSNPAGSGENLHPLGPVTMSMAATCCP